MSQSRRLKREQQRQTNKVFKNNVDTYATKGLRRLGVLAVFETSESIVPFRIVVPYDGVAVFPEDTEDDFKSNIGQIFYGHNYFDEIKHLQNVTHSQFTEALSLGLGSFAKFIYEQQGNNKFGTDDFGAIMHFKFRKKPNYDYEISTVLDSVILEFDDWFKKSDNIKLELASRFEKGKRLNENQVFISSDELT